jgi:hypothetical protein
MSVQFIDIKNYFGWMFASRAPLEKNHKKRFGKKLFHILDSLFLCLPSHLKTLWVLRHVI